MCLNMMKKIKSVRGASLILSIVLFSMSSAQAQDLSDIGRQKPVNFYGGVSLRSIHYQASGIENRRQPFTYIVSGSPVVSIYGIEIPLQFMFSKKEQSFQQPFNRFGLSPTYKWITLHGGYRNVNFSPYTLAGHTMLGGGIELNPGKLRLGVMYGRLNRATTIDTLTQSLVPFSFDRKGLAAKLGFGTKENFFDLHLLMAKDDSTSLHAPSLMPVERQVFAAANSVLGYGTKLQFFRHFNFHSDGAVSVYTRDLNSPIQFDDDQIDDRRLKSLKNLLHVNGSTEWFLAFNAGVGYQRTLYGVNLNYRRVEPEFKSMGAYYFTDDVQNLTIAPHFTLLNGRLRFNGSFGVESDNVNLQKQSTSKRIIGSTILNTNITPNFGVDLNYSNYSNNQKPNTLLVADSLKIVQTTQTFSMMPRYHIPGTNMHQMIMASVNFNGMKDYNNYFDSEANNRNVFTGQYMLNYQVSFPQKMMSLFSSLSYTKMTAADVETIYQGLTLGGNYSFAKRQFQTGLNTNFMQGKMVSGNSFIFNGSANLSYQIDRLQTIRLGFFVTTNNPGSAITGMHPSFTETRGEFVYQINLGR